MCCHLSLCSKGPGVNHLLLRLQRNMIAFSELSTLSGLEPMPTRTQQSCACSL